MTVISGRDARIIKAGKPAWVVIENVTGITSLGIEEVLSDLESEGYQMPKDKAGINSWHGSRKQFLQVTGNKIIRKSGRYFCRVTRPGQGRAVANAKSQRDAQHSSFSPSQIRRKGFLIGVLMRYGNSGRLNPLFVEEMMGFPAGWTDTGSQR
jgi:hypothetical protein